MTTPNTVDALMAQQLRSDAAIVMRLAAAFNAPHDAALCAVAQRMEASARALAAMPAQSESALAVMMDRDAWRAGLIGLCQGPEPKTREAALEHLRARLHAKSVQQAGGVPAGFVLVPKEIVDRFPEINPSNYDHDDACALNAWGVELVLAAAHSPSAVQPLSEAQIEVGARSEQFWGRTLGEIYAEGARFAEAMHGIFTPKEPT